jgi:hypothetical protein
MSYEIWDRKEPHLLIIIEAKSSKEAVEVAAQHLDRFPDEIMAS